MMAVGIAAARIYCVEGKEGKGRGGNKSAKTYVGNDRTYAYMAHPSQPHSASKVPMLMVR